MSKLLDKLDIDIMIEEVKELSAQNRELMEALRMVYGWYIAPAGTIQSNHPAYPRNNGGHARALREHVKRLVGDVNVMNAPHKGSRA